MKPELRAYLGQGQTDATSLANNTQHCWMLHVASVCTSCCSEFETDQTFSRNSQYCWPNSCCVRLHIALQCKVRCYQRESTDFFGFNIESNFCLSGFE